MTEQSPVHDSHGYEQAVRDYLADCQRAATELEDAGSSLDPKHHPTADGAVKMIPHGGNPAAAAKIRQAFSAVLMPRFDLPAPQSEAEADLQI